MRLFAAINECLNASLSRCSPNALCEDAKEGYVCRCREGFLDASPNVTHFPGRVCHKPSDTSATNNSSSSVLVALSTDPCDPNAPEPCRRKHEVCREQDVGRGEKRHVCICATNATRVDDGTCKGKNRHNLAGFSFNNNLTKFWTFYYSFKRLRQ